jgi:hypothetical protein
VADHERDDREPVGLVAAEHLMFGFCSQRGDRPRTKPTPRASITSGADGLLELEHQPGADRLDDRRRPALLAVLDLGVVVVLGSC